MEGCEKWLSPSTSTANPKPSSTGENDENDSSQDKMIPKFQNHKKTASKHFMSPTISAASKAAPPKKKILSVRNENSCNSDVQNHKISNLDEKKSPRISSISHSNRPSSQIVSSYDRASEPDDNWDTNFLDNSSVKAYDPLTNYLSPRPKYLRFNPNRRREIFSRLEEEELNGSFDYQEVNDEEIKDSSFSPLKESAVKPENEENNEEGDEKNICNDYEEEEEEEIEEESGWCFGGVIKFVLILLACVLSTSYICTMNSQSPTPTQQVIWKVKDGCLMIKRQMLEVIGMKIQEDGFLKVEVGGDYGEFEEGEFEADYNGENEESVKVEIIEDYVENSEEVEINEAKNREIEEVVKFEVEIIEDGIENLDEAEIDKEKSREIEEVVKVEIVENLEKVDNKLVENESEISKDKMDKVAEIEGARSGEFEVKTENSDRSVDAKNESVNAASFCLEKEVESSYPALNEDNIEKIEAAESETDEIENAGKYGLEMGIKGSDQLQELELSDQSVLHEKSTNSGHEVENEKVGLKTSAVIGFSVVSIVLASLAIILYYHLKKKPRCVLSEKSEPMLKPHKLAAAEEKRKIEFITIPSLSHSIKEPPKKLDHHHICAPTVELIGEIVVGKVRSRRVGKFEAESEESNAAFLPKNNNTRARPVLAPTQLPVHPEYSNISSRSYGSSATETKILKKEGGGQSGEGTMEVTPIRRSSRLRSRAAVTSP